MAERTSWNLAWARPQLRSRHRHRSARPSLVYAFTRLDVPLELTSAVDTFGCPDNVFFVKRSDWVWLLVGWQWLQIMMLFAQERFGPAFLYVNPTRTSGEV